MAEPWLIYFFACNREMQPFSFFFCWLFVGGGGGISGRVRALNLTVPLGSGRVGSGRVRQSRVRAGFGLQFWARADLYCSLLNRFSLWDDHNRWTWWYPVGSCVLLIHASFSWVLDRADLFMTDCVSHFVFFRLCAPFAGAAVTHRPGSAGSFSCSLAPPLPHQRWPYTPSWRRRRTTSTSTASGTCSSLGASASFCHHVPNLTWKSPPWSGGEAAATSSVWTSTRRWDWWTQRSLPSTAYAPADDA